MTDEQFELTEEFNEVTETVVLSESNFTVDPYQIILETSDKNVVFCLLLRWQSVKNSFQTSV